MSLHGWFVDIHAGQILGLDGETGRFSPLREDLPLPVAVSPISRRAADFPLTEAAE
jgi:carbonic anhydrase